MKFWDKTDIYCVKRRLTSVYNQHLNHYIISSPSFPSSSALQMDHDPRNPAYIATQGPLPSTVADFWQVKTRTHSTCTLGQTRFPLSQMLDWVWIWNQGIAKLFWQVVACMWVSRGAVRVRGVLEGKVLLSYKFFPCCAGYHPCRLERGFTAQLLLLLLISLSEI